MTRIVTIFLLIFGILAWLSWDIYVATNSVKGDTISEVVLAFAFEHWSVPVILGAIMGHLTWPSYKPKDKTLRFIVLCLIGILCLVLDVMGVFGHIIPILPFLCGVVLGHLLWPQSKETGGLL